MAKRSADDSLTHTQHAKKAQPDPRALMATLNLRSGLGAPTGHSERVAVYALAIGRCLDLPDKTLNPLKSAAILHDIGKVGVSRQIVDKLGRLTEREFEIMRLHSNIAIRMLERVKGLKHSLPMIKHHHERFDGKGYPDGLKGHRIPLGARIIAVAETFDMLVSELPWRGALSLDEAIQELQRSSGTQFDPIIVEAFLSLVESKQVKLPKQLAHEAQQSPPSKPN